MCYLTWREIYTIFRDELAEPAGSDPTSRLLVGQWLDYLRDQNMIPFEKLESDDFDYFNLSKDDQGPLTSHVHARLEESKSGWRKRSRRRGSWSAVDLLRVSRGSMEP